MDSNIDARFCRIGQQCETTLSDSRKPDTRADATSFWARLAAGAGPARVGCDEARTAPVVSLENNRTAIDAVRFAQHIPLFHCSKSLMALASLPKCASASISGDPF